MRAFTKIKTNEEAKDALLGARVADVTWGDGRLSVVFETIAGEKAVITVTPFVKVSVQGRIANVEANAQIGFGNT